MRRTIGGNAQDRRRARRAASRRTTTGLSDQDVRDIQSIIAAASGSSGLPLSDRGVAWDSAAADKAVRDWAGADEAPNAKYGQAFFIKDGDGANFGDYHLPFATVIDGKLTAVWRGVTAAAAALQGSRGANVEDGDSAKPKIESYYAKARKMYGDDSIKVPWAADESTGETGAFLLAYAECAVSREHPDADTVFAWYSTFTEEGEPDDALASVYTTDEAALDEFMARLTYWETTLALIESGDLVWYTGADNVEAQTAEIVGMIEEMGGTPSKGTKKDKRLKGNKPGGKGGDTTDGDNDNEDDEPADDNMSLDPELAALEAIEDFAASVKCGCGHAYSEHSGAGGTCGHEDGRGTCRCGEFAYPDSDVQALADAIVAARPDLAGFEVEVARIAERTLLATQALQAAAGDVVWGPEEGFMDLLNDVSCALHPNDDDNDWFSGPYAVDASVNLDKVLLMDDGGYFVAPITIDQTGEPVVADKTDWVSVEPAGYVEKGDGSMRLQVTLRDINLTADGAAVAETIPEVAEVIPEASDEITPPTANAAGEIPWTATFVPEGVLTEDGRAFAPGSIVMPPDEQARQLPLTLMGLIETSADGGHDRAKVAGRIDNMWREDDTGKVKASGVFSSDEWGQKIANLVDEKSLTGLSVDIAPLEWEHVARSDWFDADGNWTAVQGEDGQWAPADGQESPEPESLEEWLNADLVLAITKAVIGMATVCPFPAFGDASIALTSSGMPRQYVGALDLKFDCGCTPVEVVYDGPEGEDEATLTASAAGLAPVKPPSDWFADPEFDELTAMTITEDGRIFGHAWEWGTCHLSFDTCVTAPKSETNYAYYMLGEIECDEGDRLSVGKITLDTGHAGTRLSRADATAHYDNTGTVAAHVQFGEDEFGGWFAGAINPELSEEKVRLLRGATVSGDWRGVDGNLELVGLLAVNVPGFPVPRSLQAAVQVVDDEPVTTAMVAAGIVTAGLEAEILAMVNEVAEPEA